MISTAEPNGRVIREHYQLSLVPPHIDHLIPLEYRRVQE